MLAALALCIGIAFAAPERAELVLDDGQVLVGVVEQEAGGAWTLTLGSGTVLRFPAEIVREVRPIVPKPLPLPGANPGTPGKPISDNGEWDPDPNRSRYLYTPSAFALGKGRGYVSQKQLLLTEAAIGVTDFWDVQAATSVITLFMPGVGALGVVGTKLSAKALGKDLHIAGGAQALFVSHNVVTLGFGTVTYGTGDRHVSVSAGGVVDFLTGDDPQTLGTVLVAVSGNYRLGPRAALVSENWFLIGGELQPAGGDLFVIPSLVVRLFGPSFATDLGVVPLIVPESGIFDVPVIPIPWVGFTWNFGIGKG
jgi:hypothetical protein